MAQRFYAGRAGERSIGDRLPALELFDRGSAQRLLDIGCHNGHLTAIIRDHLGATTAWGADIDETAIEGARAAGIEAVVVNFDQEPICFEDSAFDCVHLGDVLEHIFSPDAVLTEAYRLLRPGGYVVITTPNLASWRNRIGLLFGWQPLNSEVSTMRHLGNPFSPDGEPAGHLRVFTFRALQALAEMHGFRLTAVRGYALGGTEAGGLVRAAFGLIDRLADRYCPTLSDELLVRLEKPSSD
jgi:methionine biosynthesis protein MetW